ncbi:MAG: sugar phosphate isomerase/epimerase [Verrucomicrobiaceae bacterium]|nr:sugar phosphate isomerase/epimerase [Verrucomicrobiaceae bacterium]
MNTRRHFFSTILGATAATSLRGQDAAKLSFKGENIQFGLVTYQWGKDWDIATLIKNCAEAEVTGVELRVEHKHGVTVDLTPKQRSEVRQQFEDSPVKLLGLGTNFEFHAADPEVLKKNVEGAKAFIKLSHDIGGTGVKVKPNSLVKDVPAEQTLAQIGKALAELGAYSLGFGQEIRLEVHGKDTSLLPNVKKIMEACADAENVRVCWNSNDTDLQGEGLEANFALVRERLGHTVHIRGVGQVAYPHDKLAKLLVDADYEGHVCLEAHKLPDGDPVAALKKERDLFMAMVRAARQAAA